MNLKNNATSSLHHPELVIWTLEKSVFLGRQGSTCGSRRVALEAKPSWNPSMTFLDDLKLYWVQGVQLRDLLWVLWNERTEIMLRHSEGDFPKGY